MANTFKVPKLSKLNHKDFTDGWTRAMYGGPFWPDSTEIDSVSASWYFGYYTAKGIWHRYNAMCNELGTQHVGDFEQEMFKALPKGIKEFQRVIEKYDQIKFDESEDAPLELIGNRRAVR